VVKENVLREIKGTEGAQKDVAKNMKVEVKIIK